MEANPENNPLKFKLKKMFKGSALPASNDQKKNKPADMIAEHAQPKRAV